LIILVDRSVVKGFLTANVWLSKRGGFKIFYLWILVGVSGYGRCGEEFTFRLYICLLDVK
jgi:hypothetical protein